jgi:hypothetical protein
VTNDDPKSGHGLDSPDAYEVAYHHPLGAWLDTTVALRAAPPALELDDLSGPGGDFVRIRAALDACGAARG